MLRDQLCHFARGLSQRIDRQHSFFFTALRSPHLALFDGERPLKGSRVVRVDIAVSLHSQIVLEHGEEEIQHWDDLLLLSQRLPERTQLPRAARERWDNC